MGQTDQTDQGKTGESDKTILDTGAKPATILNPDLSLADGWFDKLPEDLRGETSLKVIKTFPDLVKRTVNAEKLIGKNRVAIPGDKATPEERAAFYDAIGRPKAPTDYKFDVPEDLKELYSPDRLKAFFEMAHAEGYTQKQAEAALQHDMKATLKLLEDQEKADGIEKAETKRKGEEVLRKEFGAAYDERVHVANRLVGEMFGNDKEGELAFLEKFGNDPDFIRFASRAGAKLVEHKALVAEYQGKPGAAEAQAKIAQLRTPAYLDPNSGMNQQEREAITGQLRDLYKLAYPEPAKAGR